MESISTELALYGTRNECVRTDNVFSPISEVCDGRVSLAKVPGGSVKVCNAHTYFRVN